MATEEKSPAPAPAPTIYNTLRARTLAFASSFSRNDPRPSILSNFFSPSSALIVEHGPTSVTGEALPFLGRWEGRASGAEPDPGPDADRTLDAYMDALARSLEATAGGIDEESVCVDERRGVSWCRGRTRWEAAATGQGWWETWSWEITWTGGWRGEGGGEGGRDGGGALGSEVWIQAWRIWADPLSAWLAVKGELEPKEGAKI